MRARGRSQTFEKFGVDIMVMEYIVHEAATLTKLGNHSKEITWKLQAGVNTEPVEIKVHVDKTVATYPEVWVECKGERVFPADASGLKKSKLREDFAWFTSFRGVLWGIGEEGLFEAKPDGYANSWFPAKITNQRRDGVMEVEVQIPDQYNTLGGWKTVHFPAMSCDRLRHKGSNKPVKVPQRTLTLEVPKSDPLHATLKTTPDFSGVYEEYEDKLVTHFFARQTPQLGKEQNVIFKVDRERTRIEGNIGHNDFGMLLQPEPYLVSQAPTRKKALWVIQIGPWARHEICLERKYYANPKLTTLTIDGTPCVEAVPADLGCKGDTWTCKFMFKGETCLKYEVYESSKDGVRLNTKDIVPRFLPYVIECEVTLPENQTISDMRAATLKVNGLPFGTLPPVRDKHSEPNIKTTPEIFAMTYRQPVPWKVNMDAAHGLESVLSTMFPFRLFTALCTSAPNASSAYNSSIDDMTVLKEEDSPSTLTPKVMCTDDLEGSAAMTVEVK